MINDMLGCASITLLSAVHLPRYLFLFPFFLSYFGFLFHLLCLLISYNFFYFSGHFWVYILHFVCSLRTLKKKKSEIASLSSQPSCDGRAFYSTYVITPKHIVVIFKIFLLKTFTCKRTHAHACTCTCTRAHAHTRTRTFLSAPALRRSAPVDLHSGLDSCPHIL